MIELKLGTLKIPELVRLRIAVIRKMRHTKDERKFLHYRELCRLIANTINRKFREGK